MPKQVFSNLASTESLVLTLNCFKPFLVFQGSVNYTFFRHNRKTGSNHIWRYFSFLHWQKLHLQPLATLLNFFFLVCKSGLQIIHYILRMSWYTNIVYIGSYLVLTYIERFISTVSTWTETEARFIFEGFNNILYGKVISYSPIIFSLFLWSVNCSRDFFSHLVNQ